MEERRRFNLIKFLGMMAAFFLIVFGSFTNVWRTMKMAWNKIKKK
jgi:hypothetical protein